MFLAGCPDSRGLVRCDLLLGRGPKEEGDAHDPFHPAERLRGRRPHEVVPDRLRSRPRLLSRLLGIAAPCALSSRRRGSGKATLAFEYASVMFQFEHVFWLRGSSPCFLRIWMRGCWPSGAEATSTPR